jgi:uncharacterized tellurite resistance protein B-like protein
MRAYATDSPQAVSRLLILSVIADGGGSPAEIVASYRLGILEYAGIEEHVFDEVLRAFCSDVEITAGGLIKVEKEMVDQMLAEIVQPALRLRVWEAMWQMSYADEKLADGELGLLLQVTRAWGIEEGVDGSGPIARPGSTGSPGQ